jgi:hypothetical protein
MRLIPARFTSFHFMTFFFSTVTHPGSFTLPGTPTRTWMYHTCVHLIITFHTKSRSFPCYNHIHIFATLGCSPANGISQGSYENFIRTLLFQLTNLPSRPGCNALSTTSTRNVPLPRFFHIFTFQGADDLFSYE